MPNLKTEAEIGLMMRGRRCGPSAFRCCPPPERCQRRKSGLGAESLPAGAITSSMTAHSQRGRPKPSEGSDVGRTQSRNGRDGIAANAS